MYLLYSVATLLAAVALSPYFLYQALRHNKYVGSLGQRLGYLPVSFNLDGDESIWVHAVSVGEVLAARPIDRRAPPALSERCACSCRRRRCRGSSLRDAASSDVDGVFYFPFDWTFTVRRTLALVKPQALRHGRDRDLAEPAARVPPPRRQDAS